MLSGRKGSCTHITKMCCSGLIVYVCSCILPIGLLFAATLWMGNAAYLTLSVSFIQMLKVRGCFRWWCDTADQHATSMACLAH